VFRCRAVTSALLLLLALVAASGCDRHQPGGPVEIRYWTGWTGHELDAQKRLVDEFNRTHRGIRVRILSVAGSYQKLRIAFAGAATPDVASCVWAEELASYAARGVLSPLDERLVASGRSTDEWVPGVRDMLRYQGKTYGLTVTTNTFFIVYNKKLFREAGLDPERPPRTIEELDAAAAACTQVAPEGRLVRVGLRPKGLLYWSYAFGGSWYDPATGRITANQPGNVRALRWMASYAQRYGSTRLQSFEASYGGNATPSGPFFTGKIAMWQIGEPAREFIRRYAPGMEYGWFALPAPPGGRPNSTVTSGSVFVIPAATRHPREAWTFLNWLTQPYAVGEFCESIVNLPPLKQLASSPRFRKEPLFAFALDLASGENVFGPPPMPAWGTYTSEITRAEEAGMFGGQDPQQVLDRLQATMEKELRRVERELRR
jgi:multiple sugar transport system substrate-binding protein